MWLIMLDDVLVTVLTLQSRLLATHENQKLTLRSTTMRINATLSIIFLCTFQQQKIFFCIHWRRHSSGTVSCDPLRVCLAVDAEQWASGVHRITGVLLDAKPTPSTIRRDFLLFSPFFEAYTRLQLKAYRATRWMDGQNFNEIVQWPEFIEWFSVHYRAFLLRT